MAAFHVITYGRIWVFTEVVADQLDVQQCGVAPADVEDDAGMVKTALEDPVAAVTPRFGRPLPRPALRFGEFYLSAPRPHALSAV